MVERKKQWKWSEMEHLTSRSEKESEKSYHGHGQGVAGKNHPASAPRQVDLLNKIDPNKWEGMRQGKPITCC
jgi:hypothetical protein